jgi:histidinol-phosphate aminotransferase
MSIFNHINPALASLPTYQPGRPIEEVAREFNLPAESIIKLASNENPLGPSPKAVEAMRSVLHQLHLYPDGNAFYLKGKLAQKLGVQPENLIFGNGSNEIIEFVGHAFLRPGLDVVVSQYCFIVYPLITKLFQANLITIPARDLGHDIPRMIEAVTPSTRAIFIANPNNPTGTLAPKEQIFSAVEQIPEDVLVVMDEAYIDFLEEPPDLIPLIRSGAKPNLVLMRTFSKIYGLAGLRLGYAIAHPKVIAAFEKVRQPFNVNALIQAGAMAALDDQEHLDRTRRINREGLEFFDLELKRLGLTAVPSSANFILVNVRNGVAVAAELQKRGVITRPMAGYGLPEWLRITIGTPDENRRCLAALKEIVASR